MPSDAGEAGPGEQKSPQKPLIFKRFLKNCWYGLAKAADDNGESAPEYEHTC